MVWAASNATSGRHRRWCCSPFSAVNVLVNSCRAEAAHYLIVDILAETSPNLLGVSVIVHYKYCCAVQGILDFCYINCFSLSSSISAGLGILLSSFRETSVAGLLGAEPPVSSAASSKGEWAA